MITNDKIQEAIDNKYLSCFSNYFGIPIYQEKINTITCIWYLDKELKKLKYPEGEVLTIPIICIDKILKDDYVILGIYLKLMGY